jgi:hypothetical protein
LNVRHITIDLLCSVNALHIYCEWYFRGSSPKLGSFRDTQEFHYYSFCSFHFSATPFKTEFWFSSIDSKYVECFQAVNFLLVKTGYETVNGVLIDIMQSVTDSFWIIFHVYSVQKLGSVCVRLVYIYKKESWLLILGWNNDWVNFL